MGSIGEEVSLIAVRFRLRASREGKWKEVLRWLRTHFAQPLLLPVMVWSLLLVDDLPLVTASPLHLKYPSCECLFSGANEAIPSQVPRASRSSWGPAVTGGQASKAFNYVPLLMARCSAGYFKARNLFGFYTDRFLRLIP